MMWMIIGAVLVCVEDGVPMEQLNKRLNAEIAKIATPVERFQYVEHSAYMGRLCTIVDTTGDPSDYPKEYQFTRPSFPAVAANWYGAGDQYRKRLRKVAKKWNLRGYRAKDLEGLK